MKKASTLVLTFVVFSLIAFAQDKPKTSYKAGKAKVTVWENEKEGQYGKYIDKNFKIEKLYKKEGKWESTQYFNLEELLQLRSAIDRAIHDEVVEKED
ncbi:MAG: hypothetical protein WD048_11685 [Chitinophagales bacterium]